MNVHFKKKYGKNPTEAVKKLSTLGKSIEGAMDFIKTVMNIK